MSSVVIGLIFFWLYQRRGFINYLLGTDIAWLQNADRIFDPLWLALGMEGRMARDPRGRDHAGLGRVVADNFRHDTREPAPGRGNAQHSAVGEQNMGEICRADFGCTVHIQ